MKFFRRLKYKLYIRYLAFRRIFQINLGDTVIHEGRQREVINGVNPGCWTLSNPYELYVPKEECRKHISISNFYHSYKFSVNFYTWNWLDIWERNGIEPWVRNLPIWPRKIWSRKK